MSPIRNNNPDPASVGNSRLPKTEPPAPGLAGAGSQPSKPKRGRWPADYQLHRCVDCGRTYKETYRDGRGYRTPIYRCSDGKYRCTRDAYRNDQQFRIRHRKRIEPGRASKVKLEEARLQGFEDCEALVVAWLERQAKLVDGGELHDKHASHVLTGTALAIRLGQHRTHEGQE